MLIVSLPDFFIDRIVRTSYDIDFFFKIVKEKCSGNIIIKNQKIKYGGNAANFSIALGKLGIENTLIVETNELGKRILELFTRNLPINLFVVNGDLNMTVALEFGSNNIMLSNPVGLEDFGPEKLNEEMRKTIEKADWVCLFNWNQNKRILELFDFITSVSHAKLYVDLGDISIVDKRILSGILNRLKSGKITVLSLNEKELKFISKVLGIRSESIIEIANKVYESLNIEHLDVHTKYLGITLPDRVIVETEVLEDEVIINVTGAGDFWNAGNMYGYIKNFSPEKRLKFAHEVAKKYILGGI